MIIIAAKNAFLRKKTGIEEYMCQILRSLAKSNTDEEIIVYTNKIEQLLNFPSNFHLKIIHLPFLWTQIGLSFKMLKIKLQRKDFVLFIPAHVMPLIHPKKTIVTIHGLEYEYFPQYYSWLSRHYLRWSTRYATHYAWKIIAVSHNTKKDLVKLYHCDSSKIKVIYHGMNKPWNIEHEAWSRQQKGNKYFLYLGRIELKKNVLGIIRAFEILRDTEPTRNFGHGTDTEPQHKLSDYKLILAGPAGYGYKNIKYQMSNIKSEVRKDIVFTGHISDRKKWELLRSAEALVFPSFYEGFGMPILEAQAVGVPVITSNNSSMREITDMKFSIFNFQFSKRYSIKSSKPTNLRWESALLVNPNSPEEIAEAMGRIVTDKNLRDELIRRGYENVKRFSWKKCGKKTLGVLLGKDY